MAARHLIQFHVQDVLNSMIADRTPQPEEDGRPFTYERMSREASRQPKYVNFVATKAMKDLVVRGLMTPVKTPKGSTVGFVQAGTNYSGLSSVQLTLVDNFMRSGDTEAKPRTLHEYMNPDRESFVAYRTEAAQDAKDVLLTADLVKLDDDGWVLNPELTDWTWITDHQPGKPLYYKPGTRIKAGGRDWLME